jgi:hypothetical protein
MKRFVALVSGLVSITASLALLEGASFAQSPTARSCAHVGPSTRYAPLSIGPFATPSATSTRDLDRTDARDYANGSVAEPAFARVRICHISHHPLGRLRAIELACPLYLAEVGAIRSRSFMTPKVFHSSFARPD